ncbi:MAG: LPD38 domain-containing protein, partial [Acetobacteraceae bacterium]
MVDFAAAMEDAPEPLIPNDAQNDGTYPNSLQALKPAEDVDPLGEPVGSSLAASVASNPPPVPTGNPIVDALNQYEHETKAPAPDAARSSGPASTGNPIVDALNQYEYEQANPAALTAVPAIAPGPPAATPAASVGGTPGILAQAKRKSYELFQGLGGSYHGFMEAGNILGAAVPVMLDKLHGALSGKPQTGLEDAWFRHMVDPLVRQDADFQLGPDASFADKAVHAVGDTLGMISQAILSGPPVAEGELSTFAGRAAYGFKSMTVPAVASAIQTGRQVLNETGNKARAVAAATTSYLATALGGAVPMSVPGKLATRMASGAAIGAGMSEAQRLAQNAVLPANMRQPFSAADAGIGAIMGSLFGAVPHEAGTPPKPPPADVINRADQAASEASAAARASVASDPAVTESPAYKAAYANATQAGMSAQAADAHARQTLASERGAAAGLAATARVMGDHLQPAAAAPVPHPATSPDVASLKGTIAMAQVAGVDPNIIRAVSQSVIHREITATAAAEHLQHAIGDLTQPAGEVQLPGEPPGTIPAPAEAAPVPAETTPAPSKTGLGELGGAGKAMGENLRNQLWDVYSKGSTRMAGIEDPALRGARAAGVAPTDRAAFDNFLTRYGNGETNVRPQPAAPVGPAAEPGPAENAAGHGPAGAPEPVTPEQSEAPLEPGSPPARRVAHPRKALTPDPRRDTALQFIAKSGGIDIKEAESEGFDPADMKDQSVGIKRAFHSKGMSIESAGEALAQGGWPVTGSSGAIDKSKVLQVIDEGLHGRPRYSNYRDMDQVQADNQAEQQFRAQHEQEAAEHIPEYAEQEEPVRDFTALRMEAEKYANPDEIETAMDTQSDLVAEQRLRDIIARGREAEGNGPRSEPQAHAPGEVGASEDAGAPQLAPHPGGQGEETAPGAVRPQELTLTGGALPPREASRAPAPAAADLFGAAPVAEQALADERRRRDETRNSGQQSTETGNPSDLFSQARQQTDLTDQDRPGTPRQPETNFSRRGRPQAANDGDHPFAADRPDAEAASAAAPADDSILRAAQKLPFKRASGRQWLTTLSKRPGVDPAALERSGLKDWLGNRAAISKDELLERLSTQQPQPVDASSQAAQETPSAQPEEGARPTADAKAPQGQASTAAAPAPSEAPPAAGMAASRAARVRTWLDGAAHAVRGVADVHVVDNVEELRQALGRSDIPEDVQGVYVAGGKDVYLVANQLGTRAEAERKFVHEVFGHLAMERYGDMDRAITHVMQLKRLGGKTVAGLWDEVARAQPGLDPRTHAKEVIALMAERGVKNSIMDRLITAARGLLRKMGVGLRYTDAELRQLIASAARALREHAQSLPAEDDVSAHQAAMAYRGGDDQALGEALGRMSVARPAVDSSDPKLAVLAKSEVEPGDQAAMDEGVAHLLSGPAPKAPEGAPSAQPLYARKAKEDPEITAIRRRVMANAKYEALPLKDRARLVLQRWSGLSALSFRQGVADSFASIAAYEKLLNEGKLLDASVSPYKQTVATQNLPSVMTAIMHTGIPEYRDGAYQRATDGRKGLLQIFAPLVNHPDGNLLPQWELYAAARRSSRLITEQNADGTSREKLFTQPEIDRSLKLAEQYPVFDQVFSDWQDFNRQTLDMAQDAGLIDPDSRAMWESNDYVPFYRAMQEVSGTVNPVSLRKAISEQRARILKLKGGAQPLEDVFESALMNTAHLADASFKNRAAQMIVNQFDGVATTRIPLDREAVDIDVPQVRQALKNAGINLAENLTPEQKAQWLTFFRGVAPAGKGVISVRFNGKPQYYQVHDPLLYQSITQMAPGEIERQLRMLGFTSMRHLITRTATAMPGFMLRNFVRDTAEAWMQNHTGLTPFVSAAEGLGTAIRDEFKGKNKIVHDLMLAGAGGDAVYDNQPGKIKKIMMRDLGRFDETRAEAVMKTVVSPRRAWDAYTKVQQASENANRIAVYKAARAKGFSHAEAAYQAHDLLNFQQHGAWGWARIATGVIPFLNARIQGMDKLMRSFAQNRGAFLLKGAMMMGLTAAQMALGRNDPRYQELPGWERDMYWNFFVGPFHIRIPKPFELGSLFGTLPDRAFRLMTGEDSPRDTGASLTRMAVDTLAGNPIPPLVMPGIEDIT